MNNIQNLSSQTDLYKEVDFKYMAVFKDPVLKLRQGLCPMTADARPQFTQRSARCVERLSFCCLLSVFFFFPKDGRCGVVFKTDAALVFVCRPCVVACQGAKGWLSTC